MVEIQFKQTKNNKIPLTVAEEIKETLLDYLVTTLISDKICVSRSQRNKNK